MATNDDNNLWKKAMIAAQMQPINYWSQQGNTAALLGNILGNWLQQYIAKMSDTTTPQPEGEVNADTVSQMTQELTPEMYGNPAEMATQAMGGYTPPTTLDSVTNNFKAPLGNAGEAHTWDSLKKQIDTNMQPPLNRQAPFFDMPQSQPLPQQPQQANFLSETEDKILNDELKNSIPLSSNPSREQLVANGNIDKMAAGSNYNDYPTRAEAEIMVKNLLKKILDGGY